MLLFVIFLGFLHSHCYCSFETERHHRYTNTWAIEINANSSEAVRITEKYGLTFQVKISSNVYLFVYKTLPKISSKLCHSLEDLLSHEPLITWYAQQVRRKKALYNGHEETHFNDPRWKDQVWYLNCSDGKGMNIAEVWQQGITGKGVVVAVVDDGIQRSHPDLKDNFDPSASLDVVELDEVPDPVGKNVGHGNRCAGVIAASARNGECGVGVSFNAKLGGIRLFEDDHFDSTDAMEALALQHNQQHIDIYSCSWGPEDNGWTMDGPGQLTKDQFTEGTRTGRLGKGSIFVFAAGNGGRAHDNCAYNGYANSIFTITVTGVNRNGSIPGYAERCSAIMACTYSQEDMGGHDAIVTSGLNNTCVSTFSATSAATAMASGIIALALEANRNLTWRDVQHLIVHSSNSDVPRSDDWMKNAAGIWVSNVFGFGLMDAAALVKYAASWRTVPKQMKCEILQNKVCRSFSEYLEANLTVSEEYCGQENIIRYLEHVVVSLHVSFSRRGYLEGFVTSPSGTTSHILPYRPNDIIASDIKGWPILSLHFWGEKPQGTWRLRLQNHYPHYGFSGYLVNWTLAIYGTATDPLRNNTHVRGFFRNTSTTRIKTERDNERETSTPAVSQTSDTQHEGFGQIVIAGIGMSCFVVLLVICVVVIYKTGYISCGRGTTGRKLLKEASLSEQSEPLHDVVMRKMDTVV
ncbi:furin-1-like [Acropora millepora]|uniref:furin-1-like n=1 Tax=Acropora millepora TaxID=45264 RepID=UPI001CF4BD37|nr:furin-1-like [Acropora millepora]XP_029186535.2 furin-1-like [Acropora millepora]XP_029186536.2 furin-1-like [Acropora millepora]XP_029186537.2 furin-1-like [Acropora millepora]XP_044173098.1 furin-1-like [Acropora millepora]